MKGGMKGGLRRGNWCFTFQSLASRWSIIWSSGSLISPASSSSTFLTFSWAWMRSSSENVRWCRLYGIISSVDRKSLGPSLVIDIAYSPCMSEEMRSHRLNVPLRS